ncbi:serine/threonine-protein kinase [Streptomyces sp. NPDC046876]|uniref:serine/threonine-protein kinase n=1 Tax=Streptomyces sp. NPDC046876 TaxID=3155616 RepID=UPI0033FFCD4C
MDSTTEVFGPLQGDDPRSVAGYRLAARIGAGGMGRVYLSHTPGGRPVALKVVRPELAEDPDFRRRFRREVEAARRVRGAYTAELIDADADGTQPWLATLYVPGPSLAEAVARRGPLPVPAVLWLMAGVAEALQAIHGAGVVHRDMKPSNVLLAADGPRVIDFGISLASGVSSHTAAGTAVGTPAFMAPEQAAGGEVTPATDVFALGQTAAFAALGETLYGDGPQLSVLYRIVHSAPDLSGLPEALRPLIARCLAADPAERATPAEIVHACRSRLGLEGDAGGGPAVWREVMGPEVSVPGPVPDPTPVHTLAAPAAAGAASPWAPPPEPDDRAQDPRARRRRTALIALAAVTATGLLAGLGWLLGQQADGAGDRAAGAKGPSGSAPAAAGASGASAPSASFPSSARSGSSGGGQASGTAKASPEASRSAQAFPHPGLHLDESNSVSLQDGAMRKDRKGDVRFECDETGCDLVSDSSAIHMSYGKPGLSVDECRMLLPTAKPTRLPLAAAAAGSEFCIRHPSGDIGVLVLQVKSTVRVTGMDGGFLRADLTVWRQS